MEVFVVQHAEKIREAGDPGLTRLGRQQAAAVAEYFSSQSVSAVWSSPMRRAQETASIICRALGLEPRIDRRLRERMNWESETSQTLDEFLADWEHATRVRTFRPRSGDSSVEAADRFLACLDEIATEAEGAAIVVTHGGVTVDALRTLFGDDQLLVQEPSLLTDGVPCGAVTALRVVEGRWVLDRLADVGHLPREVRSP